MIENVEIVPKRVVGRPHALDDQRSVGIWKNSLGTGQAHEIDRHADRALVRPVQGLDLAGWECQRGMSGKMRYLTARWDELAHGGALLEKPFQQTHRLEKVEAERLATEFPGNSGYG